MKQMKKGLMYVLTLSLVAGLFFACNKQGVDDTKTQLKENKHT